MRDRFSPLGSSSLPPLAFALGVQALLLSSLLLWAFLGAWAAPFALLPSKELSGYLLLRVEPPTARVFLDGLPWPLSRSSKGRDLSLGVHSLRIEADGYKVIQRSLTISPDTPMLLRIQMEPLPVPVVIESEPSQAFLVLQQKPVGRTPWKGLLPPRWTRVRLSYPGLVETQFDIRPASGISGASGASATPGTPATPGTKEPRRFVLWLGGSRQRRPSDGAWMRFVPGRFFPRGSSANDLAAIKAACEKDTRRPCLSERWGAEEPRRMILLRSFWLDETEVTQAQYHACAQAGVCRRPRLQRPLSTKPVITVSWDDAQTYCRHHKARLPTEAEWEAAARGFQGSRWPWGDQWLDKAANHGAFDLQASSSSPSKDDGFLHEAPVASFPKGASPYGVLDLAGNVAEWTADCHHPSFYRFSPEEAPFYTQHPCPLRTIRGGSWLSPPYETRTTARLPLAPQERLTTVGFRCATSQTTDPSRLRIEPDPLFR